MTEVDSVEINSYLLKRLHHIRYALGSLIENVLHVVSCKRNLSLMQTDCVVFGVNFYVFQHKDPPDEIVDIISRINDLTRNFLA